MTPRVRGIRSIAIDVCALDEAAAFYSNVWLIEQVAADDSTRYWRGTAAYHHILSLHRAPRPAIRHIVFDAADRAVVAALHGRVKASGVETELPHELNVPGGGYGFGFKDCEGRNLAIACEGAVHPSTRAPDRPHKVTHVNLNAADYDGTTRFMTEVLGFRLIDETVRARFLHADCRDHFSLALVRHTGATLNHVAFDMLDLDSVMRGAGRMRDAGYPIEWGVGRHGPGNNVFAYFAGPEEIPLEYTSEVLQIDDTYVPRGPDHWKFPPGRADQWGVTAPPTPRLARIQQLFGFSENGHRT
jgi:catechol 2,3-dioxygenase-like lactoylglutathione lyase family enzyme/predicted enzyme related to lactoylglutathione lyase